MSLINDALKKANQAQKKRPSQGPMGAPLQPVESLKRPPGHSPKILAVVGALVVGGGSVWSFMAWSGKKGPDLAQVEIAGGSGAAAEGGGGASIVPTGEKLPPVAATESGKAVDSSPPLAPKTAAAISPNTAAATSPKTAAAAAPNSLSSVQAKIDTGAPVATTESTPAPGIQRGDVSTLRMPQPLTMPMTDASKTGAGATTIARPVAKLGITPPSGARPPAPPGASAIAATSSSASSARDVAQPSGASTGTASSAPEKGGVTFPNLQLQGIFFRMKNPSVMINRRALFVGDKISGVRIVEIQRRTVTIEKDGRRKEISMSGF